MTHDSQLSAAHAQQANTLLRVMGTVYAMIADGSGPLAGSLQRGLDLLHMGVRPDQVTCQLIQTQAALSADAGLPSVVGADLSQPLPLSDRASGHVYLQLQTAASVARIYGFDLDQGPVRSLCFFALCPDMADDDLLRMAGLDPDTHTPTALVTYASDAVLHHMDRYLARRLLAGFAYQDQLDNPYSRVPGARTGGTFDGAATHAAGQKAQQVFQAGVAAPTRGATSGTPVAVLHDSIYHA